MYRITINSEKKVTKAVYKKEQEGDGLYIDDFPGFPISDYKYVNGKVVHEPRTDRPAYDPNAPTQMDIIEAQVSYTAMMTDTVLEV